jgi:tRNA 2-thiouridine synthesizing protein D
LFVLKKSIIHFSIIIHSDPLSTSTKSALKFAETIIHSTQHQLVQIFFFGNGVYCANALLTPLSNELNIYTAFVNLANENHFPLHVCISSALRRGILSEEEAENNEQSHFTLTPPFVLSGLGSLVQHFKTNHRMIHFGR